MEGWDSRPALVPIPQRVVIRQRKRSGVFGRSNSPKHVKRTLARKGAVVSETNSEVTRALLIGAGEGARLMIREMRRHPEWGFTPVALLDDNVAKTGTVLFGVPVVGTSADLARVASSLHIDAVILAIPSASMPLVHRLAANARQVCSRVLIMPGIGSLLRGDQAEPTSMSLRTSDVLGRPVVALDVTAQRHFIKGRRVLITGAAGSIGSDLVRQVVELEPEIILGLDTNESGLFELRQELGTAANFVSIVASVTNPERIDSTFRRYQPDIVFHAAAYKHVAMMEAHPEEAVLVNIVGTNYTVRAAARFGVSRFVLVSTDKAVRPTSVMGASKRIAEQVVKQVGLQTNLSVCCVRFGNVLGSRGSVVPIFERQIAAGGPITVTDPGAMRYFMTISEAASLVLEAGSLPDANAIYMLDMGEQVPIRHLAEQMIRLHGLEPGRDIEIVYTGLTPGEKLQEDLSLEWEISETTGHDKVFRLTESSFEAGDIEREVDALASLAASGNTFRIRQQMFDIINRERHVHVRSEASNPTAPIDFPIPHGWVGPQSLELDEHPAV